MKRTTLIRILALASLSLAFNACITKSENQVVDPTTMGTSLNGGQSFMTGWSQSLSSSTDSLPSTSTSVSATLAKASALGKAMATAGNTVTIDSSMKTSGTVKVMVTIPGGLGLQTTYDTAVVKYDAQYKDNVPNNENVVSFSSTVKWVTGGVDRAEFSDADGDGVINAASANSRVKVVFTHSSTLLGQPLSAMGTIVVGPGSDANFNTSADNIIYNAYWSRSWGGLKDSTYFTFKGTELTPRDTTHLIIQTSASLATDTLASRTIDIAFSPGVILNNRTDDSLYSIHVITHKRGLFERDGDFTFTPAHPVPYGQQPDSGSFSAKVTFDDGNSATLNGTFNKNGYQSTYVGPGGVTKTVTYSKTGVVQ